MVKYVCIGVPYFIGEPLAGRTEVEAIKNSGLADELGAKWITIEPDFDAIDNRIVAVNRALAEVIAAHPDSVPLVFASCCTSCLGMMKGLAARQPEVLWFDAHGDFNTPETTPSGFLGGMPLAWLVGRGDIQYMWGVGLKPIPERAVTITDARDLDPEEGISLARSDISHVKRIDDILHVTWGDTPLYIHFDTDVIDSAELPAMNYPTPNGPSIAQTVKTLQHVTRHANVVGVLFSLWNDTLDGADKARDGTLQLVRAVASVD